MFSGMNDFFVYSMFVSHGPWESLVCITYGRYNPWCPRCKRHVHVPLHPTEHRQVPLEIPEVSARSLTRNVAQLRVQQAQQATVFTAVGVGVKKGCFVKGNLKNVVLESWEVSRLMKYQVSYTFIYYILEYVYVYCIYDHRLFALCLNILHICYIKLQYLHRVPQMDDLSQYI